MAAGSGSAYSSATVRHPGHNSSSVTTAPALVRAERRLEESPSPSLLDTIQALLERLNTAKLK